MAKNNNTSLEQKLWAAADKLRNNMDAAEYKHVVLGLIFLKYISDAFTQKYEQLKLEIKDEADPPKIRMNIEVKIYSGCLRKQDGSIYRIMPKDLK